MHKFIYISILLLFFLPAAQAQKKYIYQDSSLLQKDEITRLIDSARAVEIIPEEKKDEVALDGEIEKPDTVLYLNNLRMSSDSILNWKNRKDVAYTKYIDSLVKVMKDKKKKINQPEHQSGKPG